MSATPHEGLGLTESPPAAGSATVEAGPATGVTPAVHRFVIAASLLTALTWLFGLIDLPRESAGELLASAAFPGEPSGWELRGERRNLAVGAEGVTLVRLAPGRSRALREADLPPAAREGRARLLRVGARIETLEPTTSAHERAPPVLAVRLHDARGETVGHRAIIRGTAARGTRVAERLVPLPPEARRYTLIFTSRDDVADGTFRLADVRVELIVPTPLRAVLNVLLVLGWTALFAAAAVWLARRVGTFTLLALCSTLAAIVIGVLLPEVVTGGPLERLRESVAALLPATEELRLVHAFKLGHFATFFLAALLLLARAPRLGLPRPLLAALLTLLAVASEGMQLHLFNRTTRVADLAIDVAGIAAAALLVALWVTLVRRRAARRTPQAALDSRSRAPTASIAARVRAISSSLSVGWTRNIRLVWPSSRAAGRGAAGRKSVPSKARSR